MVANRHHVGYVRRDIGELGHELLPQVGPSSGVADVTKVQDKLYISP